MQDSGLKTSVTLSSYLFSNKGMVSFKARLFVEAHLVFECGFEALLLLQPFSAQSEIEKITEFS